MKGFQTQVLRSFLSSAKKVKRPTARVCPLSFVISTEDTIVFWPKWTTSPLAISFLSAEVDDVPLGDKLFVFACGCADVVELAFDRCGDLTSCPGRTTSYSVSKRIIDSAVDGSDGIKESRSDRDFPLTAAVAQCGKLQADVVSKRAEAVVVFDKFFVVHGIVSPAIMSIN